MKVRILNQKNRKNIKNVISFIKILEDPFKSICCKWILNPLKNYSNKELKCIFLIAYGIYSFQFPEKYSVSPKYYSIIQSLAHLNWEYDYYQTHWLDLDDDEFELQANEDLNNYLIEENLINRALISKKITTKTSVVKHNKTKKLFNFILSKYLDIELEEPKKETHEEE